MIRATEMLKAVIKAVAIAAALHLCVPAEADEVSGTSFDAGGWAGSIRAGKNGGFPFCVVRRSFPNGVEMSLAQSHEGQFFVGLKAPDWTLTKGDTRSGRLAFDATPDHIEEARAVAKDTILFSFPPQAGPAYSALFATAQQLTVSGLGTARNDAALQFQLAGAQLAIKALDSCAGQRLIDSQASVSR